MKKYKRPSSINYLRDTGIVPLLAAVGAAVAAAAPGVGAGLGAAAGAAALGGAAAIGAKAASKMMSDDIIGHCKKPALAPIC